MERIPESRGEEVLYNLMSSFLNIMTVNNFPLSMSVHAATENSLTVLFDNVVKEWKEAYQRADRLNREHMKQEKEKETLEELKETLDKSNTAF